MSDIVMRSDREVVPFPTKVYVSRDSWGDYWQIDETAFKACQRSMDGKLRAGVYQLIEIVDVEQSVTETKVTADGN